MGGLQFVQKKKSSRIGGCLEDPKTKDGREKLLRSTLRLGRFKKRRGVAVKDQGCDIKGG